VTDVVKEQVRQAVAAQEDTIRAAVTQAVQAQVQDAVQAQEDTIRAGVTQAVQAQVLEGVLAQAGLNVMAQQYQDAVAAGQVPDAQQKQISAAVDQMMASDDIKAKVEAAVTEQENQLVAQNMASGDIKAKIESAVTEQENQLIAQNMASGDIKAKIESAVAELKTSWWKKNFASADVQAKLEAAVTEQIDKLVEENYASEDVQNTVREKKATIAAAVDSLKRLKEQLAYRGDVRERPEGVHRRRGAGGQRRVPALRWRKHAVGRHDGTFRRFGGTQGEADRRRARPAERRRAEGA